jgi:pimeloyl-ACP methyl ester carboxylesterase
MTHMLRARLAVVCVAVTAVIATAVAAGAPRSAAGPLALQKVNPYPRGERGRGAGRLFTLRYASSIDSLPDLRARVAVPPGGGRVPIIVLMHGFTLDAASFNDDTYRRFASAGGDAIVIGVEMRGRGGSSGTPDGGGREIHDIVDAIDAVTARYSARVLPDAVHLIGYSGGGANVLSAAGRFPDRFASVNAFFPIADYGFDRALGWWWQCSARQREKLIEWIGRRDTAAAGGVGGADDASAGAYASRAPIFAITNFRGAPLRLFHDLGDTNVPPSHTLALRDAAARARMTNVETFLSETTDTVRWLHAAPNGDAPVKQAEPRMFADIEPTSKTAVPISRRARLAIAGYLVTREFAVWLGDGTAARGWIEYDLDARTFDITYDTLAAPASKAAAPGGMSDEESRAPWTLTLLKQRPGERVSSTINRQRFGGVASATGALRIARAGR